MGVALCCRRTERGKRVETGPGAEARARAKRLGAATQTSAKRRETSAAQRKRTRLVAARAGMDECRVETRRERQTRIPLRRSSCTARSPRLLARRAASGRMASDRMATAGKGACEVLAVHASPRRTAQRSGLFRQTPLDY